MNREPLLTYGAIAAVVSALLILLVSFGVDISDEQVKAILGFVAAVSPFVVALIASRRKVSPVEPHHDLTQRR